MNNEGDYLMISGLKHFCFCKRRWALVHVEQQWSQNVLTLDGHYMHERVHDDSFTEKRGSTILSRGMAVKSDYLRITGNCDMVQLQQSDSGIEIIGREGKWTVFPVEYKHGEPDKHGADEAQLCAQAMCLEEMLAIQIPEGAIYYGKTKHRSIVTLTDELRNSVKSRIEEMHRYFERGYTPKAKRTNVCKSCSMIQICQPNLEKTKKVSQYIQEMLAGD